MVGRAVRQGLAPANWTDRTSAVPVLIVARRSTQAILSAAPPRPAVQSAADSSRAYYPALDGLRGLAALAVAALHFSEMFKLGVQPRHAYLAVDLFFMLSGLVIAKTYEQRLLGTLAAPRFLLQRLVRLYPMMALGVLLGVGVLAGAYVSMGGAKPLAFGLSAASAALLLPSPFLLALRPWAFPGNGPLWSLSAEVAVNVAYAATVRRLTNRILIGLVAAGAGFIAWIAAARGSLDVGFMWSDYGLGLVRAGASFLAGVLIYRLSDRRRSLAPWAHLAPLIMLAVLMAPGEPGAMFDAMAVVLLFPALLIVARLAPALPVLDKVWKRLGAWSYPLYAIHYPIIVMCAHATASIAKTPAQALAGMVATAGIVCFATWLAVNVYDRPSRVWLGRLFGINQSRTV